MSKTIQNGGFVNVLGTPLNGNLLFVLSQDAKVAANPNQVAPISARIPVVAGNIAPTLIYFNDELLPGNTYYTLTAYDAAGNKTYGPEQVSLAGAGPLDLGTLVPLLISPDPLFSNPVLQNPSSSQTISGQSLTFASSASLIVNGPLVAGYLPKSLTNDFGAKCDGRIVTDWTQSSGNTTATSATANFTAADVGKLVGINNGTSGSPNALLSTTIATFVNSTTVTTTVAPNRTITPAPGGGDGWAAIGTDDSTAIGNAVNAAGSGRWIQLPFNQKCTYKQTMYISSISNVVISGFGQGSELVFLPVAPLVSPTNLAPIFVQSNFTGRRQIANAISVGATSFTLSQASDGTDLVANDWLNIEEGDPNAAGPGASENVNFDYVQVQSVAGTTVNVKAPFRVAFTTGRTFNAGNQNGLGFRRIIPSQTAKNIKLLNFKITYPLAASATLNECGIYLYAVQDAELGGLFINSAKPLCTYVSKNIDFHDSKIEGIYRVTPEIAATVDSSFSNIRLSNAGTALDSTTQAQTAAFSVDFGSAFNHFANISADVTGNTGLFCLASHDNVFTNINIGYVRNATASPQGFLFTGCYNNKIDNVILSAADTGGTALNFGNTSGFGVNINDASNLIGHAFVGSTWSTFSSLTAATDSLMDFVGNAAGPALRFSGGNREIMPGVGETFFVDLLDTGAQLNWRVNLATKMLVNNGLFQLFVPMQNSTVAFASLGAVPAAGISKYCTDCTTAATCAGAGSGHLAVSNGTNWTCA